MSCCAGLPAGASAADICKFLASKVAEWSVGVEQFDGTTILVLSVE
jgi:hypothetical protein